MNDVTQILPRPTLVAMTSKFETERAITQLVWGNITEMLAHSRVFCQLLDAPCIAPSRVTQVIFAALVE